MSQQNQRTIAAATDLEGPGLFMGEQASVRFKPAPPGQGIVFLRTDVRDNGRPARIPAVVQNVARRARRTTLRSGGATVETCEHCLSAVAGLGIDNLIIEIDGPELPSMDGSAEPYARALSEAGFVDQDEPRHTIDIEEPIIVRDGEAMISALPSNQPNLQVIYDLDYGADSPIPKQLYAYSGDNSDNGDNGDYTEEIAPARTFVLEQEAMALQKAGLGTHLTEQDVLVIGSDGPLGDNGLRFDNEPVRHKIVDLIGDLALVGYPIRGRIVAHRSGHALNHELARRLARLRMAQHHDALLSGDGLIDIRHIQRLLPHRYPMLLIDRVLEIDRDRRAVGVKNVTMNEQFLQGHYPGTPIMPGVLIVEAMAQLSGVLLAQKLEHTGKLAVLLSMDKVKLRRPVTPGDQLVIEAETVRVKSRTGHTRCQAFVGPYLAAEAQIKSMLVDAEQE